MPDDFTQKPYNAFKELAKKNAPSPKLKSKVLASTNFCRLLTSVLDLFTVKAVDSIIELIKASESNSDL